MNSEHRGTVDRGNATPQQPLSLSVAADSASGQYLTFALAGGSFAIPILSVREIRRWEDVAHIPRSPDYVLGVINLRGAVVPVLDLRARLGMELRERTPTSVVIVVRVVIANGNEVLIGCLVDGVSDVVSFAADSARPTPDACGTVDTHFVAGVATVEKELVMVLDLVRLVETSKTARASDRLMI
jgi:purine-binding chemotaxis protein CheW